MNPFGEKPESFISKPKVIGGLYSVRMTLEGIRHSIEQVLLDHDGSLRATVETELKNAIAQFDFPGEVQHCARDVIHRLVGQVVEQEIRNSFNDPEISKLLKSILADNLKNILKGMM